MHNKYNIHCKIIHLTSNTCKPVTKLSQADHASMAPARQITAIINCIWDFKKFATGEITSWLK